MPLSLPSLVFGLQRPFYTLRQGCYGLSLAYYLPVSRPTSHDGFSNAENYSRGGYDIILRRHPVRATAEEVVHVRLGVIKDWHLL